MIGPRIRTFICICACVYARARICAHLICMSVHFYAFVCVSVAVTVNVHMNFACVCIWMFASPHLLECACFAVHGVYEEGVAGHHGAVSASYARTLIDIREPLALRQAVDRVHPHRPVRWQAAVGVLCVCIYV